MGDLYEKKNNNMLGFFIFLCLVILRNLFLILIKNAYFCSFILIISYILMQIGANNCTARYRTLSGGIGESPSPTPSSDYDDNLASAATATVGTTTHGNGGVLPVVASELGGICSSNNGVKSAVNALGLTNASTLNSLTGKMKRNNLPAHNNKGLQISQKATVHYVSRKLLIYVLFIIFVRCLLCHFFQVTFSKLLSLVLHIKII